MLPHEQGMEENDCFIVFFKEQGNEKWGLKEKETEENMNSLKRNATKLMFLPLIVLAFLFPLHFSACFCCFTC